MRLWTKAARCSFTPGLLAVRAGDPLSKRKTTDLASLRSEPMITLVPRQRAAPCPRERLQRVRLRPADHRRDGRSQVPSRPRRRRTRHRRRPALGYRPAGAGRRAHNPPTPAAPHGARLERDQRFTCRPRLPQPGRPTLRPADVALRGTKLARALGRNAEACRPFGHQASTAIRSHRVPAPVKQGLRPALGGPESAA
jgi:hypothetical protein